VTKPYRVSIIVNNYNYARFLRDAIDSALQQTYSPVEVIVVDDGSTDESRPIILSYGERVTPIFQANGGQAAALNTGFARSQGDIVIFLDADDMLLPQTVAQVVTCFAAHPQVARVQYPSEVIDVHGRRTGEINPSSHLRLPSGYLWREFMLFPADMTSVSTSGNAFAASVLRRILPIPEKEFRILADYYLSHLTPLFGPMISLPNVGALYRIHGANHYASRSLNLDQVRASITHLDHTRLYTKTYADELDLCGRPECADDILSVAHLMNRAISLKLEPARHPMAQDNWRRLLRLSGIAIGQRFDVALPMQWLYRLWFATMMVAPRPLAQWLAEQALFPARRAWLNRALRAFQNTPPGPRSSVDDLNSSGHYQPQHA
jgi:glycosyltransferase involved in cell wall biosynthesis